jgi:glycosyltransferase involved in cell wall biosynthesis
MTIDVLMPVHGDGKFLLESISSFSRFSIPGAALVLVLDRPTTKLTQLLDSANLGPDCRILISPGSGIVDALNFGISQSKANYIARLDSDDLLLDSRLQKQRKILDTRPEVICVGTQIQLIDQNGKVFGFSRYPTSSRSIAKRLRYQNCLAHPTVMFRRVHNGQTVVYRKAFTGAEDYDLWLRMQKYGTLLNLKEKLTQYRITESQYSSTFRNSIKEIENLSRATNAFQSPAVGVASEQLSKEQCGVEFRKLLRLNLIKSPILCCQLIASSLIGEIIKNSSLNRSLGARIVASIPSALGAFILSPTTFLYFCIGLFRYRTVKSLP